MQNFENVSISTIKINNVDEALNERKITIFNLTYLIKNKNISVTENDDGIFLQFLYTENYLE